MVSILKDLKGIAEHPYPFIHPEDISPYDEVHEFSAVIGEGTEVINSSDFICYETDSSVSTLSMSCVHNIIQCMCIIIIATVWTATQLLPVG